EKWGWALARAAVTARARGRPAQGAVKAPMASGSAATRSAPRRLVIRSLASAADSGCRPSRWAPLGTASRVSWLRLVTMTGQQGPDLVGVAGVVQHDEDLAARGDAEIQPHQRVVLRGDLVGRDGE